MIAIKFLFFTIYYEDGNTCTLKEVFLIVFFIFQCGIASLIFDINNLKRFKLTLVVSDIDLSHSNALQDL